MWERTLQDLIRGLRANKNDEAKFIAQANEEIRREIKSKDMELKAGAVMKLTYVRVCPFFVIPFRELMPSITARNARLRHVLGVIPRRRGHVFSQDSSQGRRVSCRSSVIRPRHRCPHAHNKPS